MKEVDTQLREILGRNILVNEMIRGGLEVARPERDAGIDLIGFFHDEKEFISCPVQLKAASKRAFIVDSKYAKFPTMLHTFVWRLGTDASTSPEVLALTWKELRAFGARHGWDQQPAWEKYGYWRVPDAKGDLLQELQEFRIDDSPHRWTERLRAANAKL